MPQFRQDFITKEWVIVAPERAKRPDEFKRVVQHAPKPAHDPKCPFCTGNEKMTPEPVLAQGAGDKWTLRVVPNKFAAVSPTVLPVRKEIGKFLSAGGFGVAEVVVETPVHNTSIALMARDEVVRVIDAYKSRFESLAKDANVDLITIFRNHGERAGTSLEHPHSQIIATPIVPPRISQIIQQARLYHDSFGGCPYCVMADEELSQRARVIYEGKHFAAFCPYASRTPFEVMVIPRRHCSQFGGISGDETEELAEILRTTLKKLYVGLGDPDYNFVIRTSPTSDGELHYDHWRLVITPRITTPAGFEIGSGIFINSMPPENAAEFLRGVEVE